MGFLNRKFTYFLICEWPSLMLNIRTITNIYAITVKIVCFRYSVMYQIKFPLRYHLHIRKRPSDMMKKYINIYKLKCWWRRRQWNRRWSNSQVISKKEIGSIFSVYYFYICIYIYEYMCFCFLSPAIISRPRGVTDRYHRGSCITDHVWLMSTVDIVLYVFIYLRWSCIYSR